MLTLSKLYQITQKIDLPDFVKQADVEAVNKQYNSEHPIWVYADESKIEYPCYDAVSTIISFAEYLTKQASYSPAYQNYLESRFSKFAYAYNVENEIEGLRAQYNNVSQQQVKYALETVDPNGNKVAGFPIKSAMDIDYALEYLSHHWYHFDYPVRQSIAKNILRISEENGFILSKEAQDVLERIAGDSLPFDKEQFKKTAAFYAQTAKSLANAQRPELQDLWQQISYYVSDNVTKEDVHKCLELMTKVAYLLNNNLSLPPELLVFPIGQTMMKEELEDIIFTKSGSFYSLSDLKGLTKQDLRTVFTEDELACFEHEWIPALELKKFAMNLTPDQAERFDDLLASRRKTNIYFVKEDKEIPI